MKAKKTQKAGSLRPLNREPISAIYREALKPIVVDNVTPRRLHESVEARPNTEQAKRDSVNDGVGRDAEVATEDVHKKGSDRVRVKLVITPQGIQRATGLV